jgi:glycosyltransferase involved in cell wall biosynthesis
MKYDMGAGPKILALGLRGIPNVPGGVEVHASELYPRLTALGARVTVLGRAPYRPADSPESWNGVSVRWLWSPRVQGVEALVHTLLGVLYAAVRRPDVVHIHAIGPWLAVPLAKMLGLKVVVTHHGEDYLREKWNAPARAVLRLGECLGMLFADERIVISGGILELARSKYRREASLIPNGVGDLRARAGGGQAAKYGLTPYRYIVQVSRLVPEKRQLDLIAAFDEARIPGWKLLLIGGAQGSQDYADQVRLRSAGNPAIVSTGFLSPPEVHELLSSAGMFVLPSSHEGLPISLLEAMKLGTPVLASDIPANLEVGLDPSSYFHLGDVQTLAAQMRELAAMSPEGRASIAQRLIDLCERYNWDTIADSTFKVLARAAGRRHGDPERRAASHLAESYQLGTETAVSELRGVAGASSQHLPHRHGAPG